jgi:transposase InsO family protein
MTYSGRGKTKFAAFVDHYNHRRDHDSLNNLTPADVYSYTAA